MDFGTPDIELLIVIFSVEYPRLLNGIGPCLECFLLQKCERVLHTVVTGFPPRGPLRI